MQTFLKTVYMNIHLDIKLYISYPVWVPSLWFFFSQLITFYMRFSDFFFHVESCSCSNICIVFIFRSIFRGDVLLSYYERKHDVSPCDSIVQSAKTSLLVLKWRIHKKHKAKEMAQYQLMDIRVGVGLLDERMPYCTARCGVHFFIYHLKCLWVGMDPCSCVDILKVIYRRKL